MAHRKSRLKISKQGVVVNADVRVAKLDPETVASQPEVIRRDRETGSEVTTEVYDKATGEPLEEGYGYRDVNEAGEEVPTKDIQRYQVRNGSERQFSRYEPTIGDERTVTPFTWIPVETVDRYLVDRTYELWGEDPADVAQLYDLANLIRIYEEAPVIEFVLTPSEHKSWGIITPQFFDERFALIIRITREKITPQHDMPLPSRAGAQPTEAVPTLEQESPF